MTRPSGPTALAARAAPSLILAVLLSALMLLSLRLGRADLPTSDIVGGAFGWGSAKAVLIVQELRLPRTLLAVLVGAALGLSGAVLQGFLRNPLSEPGVIGISSAAGLGGVIAIYYGLYAISPLATPLCAMAGAAVATGVLYIVATRSSSTLTLILAGVAIGSLATAMISLAMNLSGNAFIVAEMVFWLLGSVNNRTLADIALAAPFLVAGMAVLLSTGRSLDALSLGEETAQSLGLNLGRARIVVITGVTLCVGAAVSVAGAIGFVGLVVPHLLRPVVGHMPSRLLVPSALGGACLLLAADIGVRLLAKNAELNLGVITALIGAPFFLHLILTQRRLAE